MKKALIIVLVLGVLVVGGVTASAWLGVRANDTALAGIKDAPDVIALRVSGMT